MKIINILKGIYLLVKSIFTKKEYKIKFNHENDNNWYVDFPNWPFDHYNLMMVAGADKLCDFLSENKQSITVNVIPSKKEKNYPEHIKLVRVSCSILKGSTYKVINLNGFNRDIWLCPVTLFVLGKYPKYLYVKKEKSEA